VLLKRSYLWIQAARLKPCPFKSDSLLQQFLDAFSGASWRRARFFASGPAFRDEAVADPGLSLDVLLSGFAFELFAQLAYKDAQVFGLVGRLRSPDGREQGAMSDHFAGVAS
jgi:hypothetical protein